MFSAFLILHVCGAMIALIAGTLAMIFRKGSGRHGAAGVVFFIAMVCMSSSAVLLALFHKPNRLNLVAGMLTFYLVTTAWVAAKRRSGKPGTFDVIAVLIVLVAGIAGWTGGTGGRIFGSIALLFAVADVRTFLRGGVDATKRIARHLWRMCLAFLIAALSFYPGQARLFPKAWRDTNLLILPVLVLAGATIFWLVRVRRRSVTRSSSSGYPVLRADPRTP